MKKIITAITLSIILSAATGCLKDDGFDREEYGSEIKEVKAISFPESRYGIVHVEVAYGSSPVEIGGPFIAIENETPPPASLDIEVEENAALVAGAGLTPLPAGSYTINKLTATIPAGERDTEDIIVTLTNPSLLDRSVNYGIAFRIKSATQGYIAAANMRQLIYSITID